MLKTTWKATLCAVLATAFAIGCSPQGDDHDGGDEHAEGADHDDDGDEHGEGEEGEGGGMIHLTPDQVEGAGIRTQTAAAGLVEETLRLDAVVAENEDRQSHINPRASGLVRAIHKRLGDTVEKGDLLCEIDSVELGEAVSAYQAASAMAAAASDLLEREKELFAQRIETTTKALDGTIKLALNIRDREKQLESKGISTLRPLLEAEQALQEAELGKDQALTELRALRDSRLLELQSAATTAAIAKHAAEDSLRILGIDPTTVRAPADGARESLGLYNVVAPRSGVIATRDVTLDEFVGPETALFEIHDPSIAWIAASVYERDLRRVRRGQTAYVTMGALPGARFEGTVDFIAYEVSATTRAASVRVEIPNDPIEQWPEPFPLRPGMFGAVEIVTASRQVAISIPEAAIVHEGAESFVFVRNAPGQFERREVTIGAHGRINVEVLSGLEAGDDVAVEGTFVLKSAARAGELGGGHSH